MSARTHPLAMIDSRRLVPVCEGCGEKFNATIRRNLNAFPTRYFTDTPCPNCGAKFDLVPWWEKP